MNSVTIAMPRSFVEAAQKLVGLTVTFPRNVNGTTRTATVANADMAVRLLMEEGLQATFEALMADTDKARVVLAAWRLVEEEIDDAGVLPDDFPEGSLARELLAVAAAKPRLPTACAPITCGTGSTTKRSASQTLPLRRPRYLSRSRSRPAKSGGHHDRHQPHWRGL